MSADIAVIGTGYVGLTTGACLAHLGHDVVVRRHRRPTRSSGCSRGEIPIVEDGLDELVREGLAQRATCASCSARPTPCADVRVRLPVRADARRATTARPTCRYIEAAARRSGPCCRPSRSSSTSRPCRSARPGRRAGRSGRTRRLRRVEPRVPPRGLGGARLPPPRPRRHRLRRPGRGDPGRRRSTSASTRRSIVTDPASAETIKYASNAFLATKLSFVNAIAAVCEAVGADVNDVVLGMGYDKRIGNEFLRPGPGWGGSCFPKDTRALVRIAEDGGYDFDLLEGRHHGQRAAVRAGRRRRSCARPAARSAGCTVAAWGLTFKARTDDLRDSPALDDHPPADRRGRDGPGLRPRGHELRRRRRHRGRAQTRTRPARTPTCWSCSPSGTSSAGSTSTRWPAAMTGRGDRRQPATCSTGPQLRGAGFDYQGIGR